MGDPVEVEVDASELHTALHKLEARLNELTPALEAAGEATLDANERHFDSEGDGRWPELARSTVRARHRLGFGSRQMLVRSGTLRDSLVHRDAPGNVFRLAGNELEVGTNLPYAAPLHVGTEDLPARQLVSDPEHLIEPVSEAMVNHVEGAF